MTTALETAWRDAWPAAIGYWSRYTQIRVPLLCLTPDDEKREGLTSSFAMIRLLDHAVVVSLRQVIEMKLEGFPLEVLAHEVGHHVLCPGDLGDQARLIGRVRRGLPGQVAQAGLVANLYADLLINYRLQRDHNLSISGVYAALPRSEDKLWTFYMRTYEILWSLQRNTLATGPIEPALEGDAQLCKNVLKVYAKDWLRGAGRFAALIHPYLREDGGAAVRKLFKGWLDVDGGPGGEGIPDGLASLDDDEEEGNIHPALDPDLAGDGVEAEAGEEDGTVGRNLRGTGRTNPHRQPSEYAEILKAAGVKVSEDEMVCRYYRELAIPHLVKFPVKETREAKDPLPESLDIWDAAEPIQDVDWFESASRSPVVIPGVTTVKRLYGTTEGTTPTRIPVDLYIGIDCSGSMHNPKFNLSYPVVAATVLALSAFRVKARVMVVLSGEPGAWSATEGFVSSEKEVLGVLTGYHGTGYAFGLNHLRKVFAEGMERDRKVHVMIVSDSDIFAMLQEKDGRNWDVTATANTVAGGGGTFVLNLPQGLKSHPKEVARLNGMGYDVHAISSWEGIVAFARAFSRKHYEEALRAK